MNIQDHSKARNHPQYTKPPQNPLPSVVPLSAQTPFLPHPTPPRQHPPRPVYSDDREIDVIQVMYPEIGFGIMYHGMRTIGYRLGDRPNLEDRDTGGSMGLDL